MSETTQPDADRFSDGSSVLDELDEQLGRFRLLRKTDEAATDALLDGLGATTQVDRDIVLQLSATRVFGTPDQFDHAHEVAMRSLEVLDRNGARQVQGPAWLGPLRHPAAYLIQNVCRFIVRKHQMKLIDAIGDLYERRLAWTRPGMTERRRLLVCARDVRRVAETYKSNPVGVPTFLLGGFFVSGIGSLFRSGVDAALGNEAAAYVAVAVVFLVFLAIAGIIIRGAAVARRRIKLTTERPMTALWETIGRAGDPPKDQARTFALYGIALTAAAWLVIPTGVVVVLSAL
jgi:hypothetical protein